MRKQKGSRCGLAKRKLTASALQFEPEDCRLLAGGAFGLLAVAFALDDAAHGGVEVGSG